MLHDFLSCYIQELMACFMVFFALIKSIPIKVSKKKVYILLFICANFVPITESLACVYVGEGIIKYTAGIFWILELGNYISQLIMIFFIVFVFDKAWYMYYWWGIVLQSIILFPVACLYSWRFVDNINGKIVFRSVDLISLPEYFLYLLITFLTGCIVAIIGKYIMKIKILRMISKWYWYIIYTVWAAVQFVNYKSYGANEDNPLAYVGNLKQLLVFIIILFITLFLIMNRADKRLIKMENDLLKQQNEIQYENYLTMQQQETEIHKLYHDIGNHIETIRVLINEGENKEAKEYTESLALKYKNAKKYYYCSNRIINAVLVQKFKVCELSGITYDFDLKIPDVLPISNIDLMSLFSNLLDNAIESCKRKVGLDNYINIKAVIIGNYFTVKVINSKSSKDGINIENKSYQTWKKDKSLHGYGLKIINEIIQRYDGKFEFKNNKDSFSAMIMLKMEQ